VGTLRPATVRPRASARTQAISPSSAKPKLSVSDSGPSASVARAVRSSTACQRTPWLGSRAVGYQAASAKKRISSPSATSPCRAAPSA
jgi:hypothetical protein